jgi:hypothetical protein
MTFTKISSLPCLIFLLLIITIVVTGCADLPVNMQGELNPTQTKDVELTPIENETTFLSPCSLVTVAEMEEIFSESPLFLSEENGTCVIKNQWDTRSIRFFVFQGEQALTAMQWHTRNLVADWNYDDLQSMATDIIEDENNQSLSDLQKARLPFYEELEYRWERIFTFGDVSYWILNPRAFKGIFDVVEGDIFYQIGYSGFLAAQIQPQIEDLSKEIFSRLPETFSVESDFANSEIESTENPETENIPEVINVEVSSQEIYFGSLCGEESTTISVVINNSDLVDNVFLVFRLRSNSETNDNWTTLFMNQKSNENWEIALDAENSFLTYQLVNGAQVEYKVSIIYAVNNVVTSPTLNNILILHCQ